MQRLVCMGWTMVKKKVRLKSKASSLFHGEPELFPVARGHVDTRVLVTSQCVGTTI